MTLPCVQITGVRGDPEHPANFGRLCTKGSTLHLTATPVVLQGQRLRQVLHRPRGGVATQAVGWDEANARTYSPWVGRSRIVPTNSLVPPLSVG